MPCGCPKLLGRTRVRLQTSTHHISLKGTSSPRPLPRLQARAPWSTIRLARASAFTLCGAGHAVRSFVSHASTKFRCVGVKGRQAYFSCSVCQSVATAALNSDSHGTLILISAVPAAFCARNFAARRRRPLSESNSTLPQASRRLRAREHQLSSKLAALTRVFASRVVVSEPSYLSTDHPRPLYAT